MGNLISDTTVLYALDWTPLHNADEFTILTDDTKIPFPLSGKLLIPTSRMSEHRQLAQLYHHHTVLVEDGAEEEPLSLLCLRGAPICGQYELSRQPALCRQLEFDCYFCPIPLILERFHESYVRNYLNSFHFYGVRVMAYPKVQHFLKAQCTNRFLVCSNYELQQLSFKMRNRPGAGDPSRKLTVLCFCNRQEYTLSKRIELFLQRQGIEVFFFQNILDIIERISSDGLITPPGLQQRTQRVLFYLSEKEKEVEYLGKMAKRLQRSLRNVVIERVNSKNALVERVAELNYAIVVVSSDAKQMRSCMELLEGLERQGLEDRVMILRRDNEINEKLTQRLCCVVERPKYKRVSLLEKELVFYGSLQAFKTVLRAFPSLRFKRFIDSTREKEKLLPFLCMQTEVVVSTVRLCTCQQEYARLSIKCRVLLLRCKNSSTVKAFDRRESLPACERQQWFLSEEELLSFFRGEKSPPLLSVCFPYASKKMTYVGRTLHELFAKMKEKKTILYNKLNDSMLLFSTQYYTLDSLAISLLKAFTTKDLGNYEQDCMFPRLKAALFEELSFLADSKRIEGAVLAALERDTSADVFELAQRVMRLLAEFPELLQQVNSIWALLLHQDRKQHPTHCQTLFFLFLLAFSKTNFLKYSNQSLQSLTLVLKKTAASYDTDNLATFRNKNRNNFVYNVEFLACEVQAPGTIPDPGDTLIKLEGSQLTSFGLYLPLWMHNNVAIICPFSKFEINVKPERQALLKLNVNSQQKLLEKFSQAFLEQNSNQLKLFGQEREMRRLDAFLDSMAHSRFETAGYLLKKLAKEEALANQDCLNAFHLLYHLKRGQLDLAQQKLRPDKYHDVLSRVLKSLLEQGGVGPAEAFSSSKRIEENNKEYQNLEQTSNDNESFDSAMVQTDPNMLKQLSSDYRLLNSRLLRNRSPSSKIKQPHRRKPAGKVPIRRKPELSISDKLSDGAGKEKPLSIIILPPIKDLSGRQKPFSQLAKQDLNSSTFGNKFMTDYSSLSSDKEKKSSREDSGELSRMKSTRSDAGDRLLLFEDGVIESSPMLKHKSSIKQSLFLTIEREKCNAEEDESRGELISLIEPTLDHEQTGNFNFLTPEESHQEIVEEHAESINQADSIHEADSLHQADSIHEVPEEEEKQSGDQQQEVASINEELAEDSAKPFPIKKDFFKFPPRKSLTEMHENLGLLESPLRKIEEERSSQFSLSTSTAKFLLSSPEKENLGERTRPKENKLFTFYKISDPLKPRFSLSSNKNSLNLSNTSELGRIDEHGEPLFTNFQQEKEEREDLSDLHSISSIEIEEAEQVFPEELVP